LVRIEHTIKVKAEKGMTEAQRKAIEDRERKRMEDEASAKRAAEKLERKRREAEERLRAQKTAAAPAAPSGEKLAEAKDLLTTLVASKKT
jgi:hypothetical protein